MTMIYKTWNESFLAFLDKILIKKKTFYRCGPHFEVQFQVAIREQAIYQKH